MALAHVRPFATSALFENGWTWTIADAARELCPIEQSSAELARWPTREELTALHARAAHAGDVPALRFVPHMPKQRRHRRPAGPVQVEALYDGSIARKHEVPTRTDNWHDLFNALVFASFPRSKHALHTRQLEQQELRLAAIARGELTPGVRTRAQDTLTLFDEGGCIVAADRTTLDHLLALDRVAFHAALAVPGDIVIAPFGHALFEHMVAGIRCPGAFACFLELAEPTSAVTNSTREQVALLDRALAQALNDPARFALPTELRRLELADLPTKTL